MLHTHVIRRLSAGIVSAVVMAASCAYGQIVAGIAPHHTVAAPMIERFYEKIGSPSVRRVWLFSPDHYRAARQPMLVCDHDIGRVKVDTAAAQKLASESWCGADARSFSQEHGIAVHLPYIERAFPGAAVLPVLFRPGADDLTLLRAVSAIWGEHREGDIYILSMDCSHYKDPDGLRREDARTVPVLERMRSPDTRTVDIDAPAAAAAVMMLARRSGASKGQMLERADTTEMTGTFTVSGTSYITMIYAAGDE